MDVEKLTEIINSQGKQIDLLIEKYNDLEKKFKDSPPHTKQNRQIVKNITFEEAFLKCKKAVKEGGVYPCMYLPKSGKNKGNCCGSEAVFMDSKEDDEQVRIEGKITEDVFHSLRCNTCRTRGRANSESKKKCIEKIKGINVSKPGEVNESALSFLSGVSNDVVSPSKAIGKGKNLPAGTEVEYDDYFHYIVKHDGNSFIFERSKNKSGTPCVKKTPTLRGFIDTEDVDEDDYTEKLKTDIPEELFDDIKKRKKFKFDGKVISNKKTPVVPQMAEDNDAGDDSDDDGKKTPEKKTTDVDDILDGLDVE